MTRPEGGEKTAIPKSVRPVVKALIIGLLAVGVLLGTRLTAHPTAQPTTHLTPTHDPAIVNYRSLVNADMRTIDIDYKLGWACKTRATCAAALLQNKTATEILMREVSQAPAPAPIVAAANRVKATAQGFIDQLNAAMVMVQEPGVDYIAASATPDVHELDFAVAALDCWPAKPVEVGYHTNISCE